MAFSHAGRAISRKLRGPAAPSSTVTTDRALTRKILLELVRVDAANRFSNFSSPAFGPDVISRVDHSYLVNLAYREDLAPLVYHTLSQANFGTTSGFQVSKFRYMYYLTQRRNAQAYQQLSEVLRGLQLEGIEPLVLKGAALASQVYTDPGLRPFADMDILVRQNDLERAHQALQDLGYRINHKGQALTNPSSTDVKYRSARQYFHPGSNFLSMDFYWQLGRYPYIDKIDYAGLWERSSSATLEGTPALVPSPEDEILHLSLDFILGVWYGRPELKSLRDIAEIALRHEMDWQTMIDLSRVSGLSVPLYYSCRISKELLGADIPTEVLIGIHPNAGRRHNWIIKRLEKHIFGTGLPVEYVLLIVLMRLSGPESYIDKAKWVAQLMIPPWSLWGGVPRNLRRVLKTRSL